MIYYSNGGFNWNDVYYMPTKLREFYWNELLLVKKEESDAITKVKSKKGNRITR